MIRIAKVDMGRTSFARALRALPREIQGPALGAITDLTQTPIPARLRFEKRSGYKRPDIYTIHITRNHSHKLSFELSGDTAILRKIGTHKEIDRSP